MSRETFLALLNRLHADLAFRRKFERCPEAALVRAGELTGEEWRLLVKYPSVWLPYHSVKTCPQCGELAIVSRDGEVAECLACRPDEELASGPTRSSREVSGG